MGKRLSRSVFLLLILAVSPAAWGNSFFSRVPQFNLPQGEIAFMGCYWSPLTIFANGGGFSAADPPNPGSTTNLYHSGNVGVGFDASKLGDLFEGADTPAPAAGEAANEVNQMVLEKGPGFGLALAPVNYNTVYQNALLMHVLSPAQWGYNPQLTKYCGGKPYILIGIIDYDGVFAGPAKVREKENDQPINYWGKRSVLEQDIDVFANKKAVHSAALEFFLISTADGSTLWQGNLLNSTGKGNNYQDLMRGLVENALKNLARK
jgi:hypothetical protein